MKLPLIVFGALLAVVLLGAAGARAASVPLANPVLFVTQVPITTEVNGTVSNTFLSPGIVLVPNQPTNCNNVSPCYATDGRIIFATDRPPNGQSYLYPTREEYKGHPTVTGLWSLDPATGDLRLIEHAPSGAFQPFIDSFGRLIVTRWDHLVQDANSTDDRIGRATNGAFNLESEVPGAAIS